MGFANIIELFKSNASKHPTSSAIVNGDESYSYENLNRDTDVLAAHLLQFGTQKGDLCFVFVSTAIASAVSLISVMKAGKVYVPVSLDFPDSVIRDLIRKYQPGFMILDQSTSERFEKIREPLTEVFNVCYYDLSPIDGFVNNETKDRYFAKEENLDLGVLSTIELTQEDPCYIYFTSGTSGEPKGILGAYKGINHFIDWEINFLGLTEGTRVSQFTSPTFDAFLRDLFVPLCSKGTLCIPPKEEGKLKLEGLVSWIKIQQINLLHCVPTMFRELINLAEGAQSLPDLQYALLSGESLYGEDIKNWSNTFGQNTEIINLYGPSETTMIKFAHRIVHQEKLPDAIPIGKPINGCKAILLDQDLRPVVKGNIGEIYIKTDYRSLGYYQNQELTDQVFIKHAMAKSDNDLLYKTGDLGVQDAEGNFHFKGRKDFQVKINGIRVELSAIESVLLSMPEIEDAVVFYEEQSSLLAACLKCKTAVEESYIKELLGSVLAPYMVPMFYANLEAFPKNTNGKTNRKELLVSLKQLIKEKNTVYVAPRNETESQLVEIWQKLLNREEIGVLDNFFEIGGHSLMAIRVVAQVKKRLGTKMSIKDVFNHPTIESLAGILGSDLSKDTTATGIQVVKNKPSNIPLSYAQERLWFVDQMSGSTEYHMPYVQTFGTDLDVEAMKFAISSVIERHEVLRTIIREENGVAFQEIISADQWEMDQEALELDVLQANADELIQQEIARPFDLKKDYALRAKLYKVEDKGYLFILVLHHIASDGWSMGIVVSEMLNFYQAYKNNQTPDLQAMEIQYADYALWQRNSLKGEVLDSKINYWAKKLQGVEPINLPLDYLRPQEQSVEGNACQFQFDAVTSKQLYQLAKAENVTTYMVLLAAFKVLLSRYSGQSDICVGSPVANREQKELEGLIGFFANTIALRNNVDGNATFKDFLVQIKKETLDAYGHQDAPFEKIVDKVVAERDMSRSPIFQVMFVLQNTPEEMQVSDAEKAIAKEKADFGFFNLQAVTENHRTSKFDLTLHAFESEDQLSFEFEYCKALFKPETIQQMAGHFQNLIAAVLEAPATKLNSLNMLAHTERQQLLYDLNDTLNPLVNGQTVVNLFEEQVSRRKDAVALIQNGKAMTYGELNERSLQLAHALRTKGIKEEDLVGLFLDRSIEMIIAMLGVLRSGAAYVPMNIEDPVDRIQYIIEETQCKLVLSQKTLQSKLADESANAIMLMDDLDGELFIHPTTPVVTNLQPANLAYIIFTSGSTGKPKGAMVEHAGMLNHLLAKVEAFDMDEQSVTAFTAPYTFDISVWQILSTLISGGQVVVYNKEQILNPTSFLNRFKEDGINVLQVVPSYLLTLLESSSDKDLEELNCISVTGEAVSKDLLEQWFEQYPDVPVLNAYGPTEASDDVTHFLMTEAPDNVNVPIGKPLRNFKIYIVSAEGQLCPVGVPGELWVAGLGVGRGYINNAEKTNANFISNPFSEEEERLYKTGDLARWLSDGNLEYLGRIDDQVKVNGNRIELGEIENAIQELQEVHQNVVVAIKGSNNTKRLVAYVVSENTFDRTSIQEHLNTRLPKFMVPSIIIELDELPLTVNGKVNKKALPAPDVSEMVNEAFVEARNPVEDKLVTIWENLLDVEQVGVFDNFFELGGHSLLVMRVIAAIRKELNFGFEIRDFFMTPTIAGLADRIRSSAGTTLLPPVTALAERPEKIPLSYSQERLWFIDKTWGSDHYHVPFVQGFNRDLDLEALEYAIANMVNRHEVLRTVIVEEDGIPYQKVLPQNSWSISVEVLDENAVPEHIEQLISEEVSKPFDFTKDHMLRARVLDMGSKGYLLVMVLHHIASDEWSNNILINELYEYYISKVSGESSGLSELEIQYADYAIWQRQNLKGEVLEEKLSFWENKLQGHQQMELPLDFPRPALQSYNGDTLGFGLSKSLTEDLQKICKEEGVTLYMLLVAALKVLLYRYSGQPDVCIGSPIANRGEKELQGLVGLFINSVALRSDLSGNPTFKNLLTQVKQMTLEVYNHQDTPFEKVVDRVVKERDLSLSPLFQVMLILENTSGKNTLMENNLLSNSELPISHFGIEEALGDYKNSKFDLTFKLVDAVDGIRFNIDYCTDLFKRETIERMGAHFTKLLQGVAEKSNAPIDSINILTAFEKQQLLLDFNDTKTNYPLDKTIVDLFKEQVAKTPEHAAIVFEGQELTYQELDERSNQLGHSLVKRGVQEGSLVGVCMDRSLEMMIGILGILKAGGAYVPIDPQYPKERIEYMIEDAEIGLVLGNQDSLHFMNKKDQILLDIDWPTIGQESTKEPKNDLEAEHLIYVIYTSGSTGKPKGVMNQHSGVVNRLLWAQEEYQLNSEVDVVLQKTTFCFDVSVWELFWPIITGVKLVFASPEGHKDTAYLKSIIEEEQVTTMHFVPSMLEVFLLDVKPGDCKSLKRVLCSGEALTAAHVNEFKKRLPQVELHNLYGPTEAAIDVSYWPAPMTEESVQKVPIGKPVANTQLYVLDANDQLVPVGVSGELHIGGIQVARGYKNKPDLTAKQFIQNKFDEDPNSKLYRTGDLVRWLPDGNIEYIGRKDFQVKIRGYRIELGEIEETLKSCPLVRQGVVLAKEDKQKVKRLVAYVVPQDVFDREQIQKYMEASLPEYMVPALFVELNEIPLNHNGKVDRKALPDPDASTLINNDYVAPRNKIETVLTKIWQDLLGVKQVGVEDDFFDLGGYSLLATRVVSAIKKQLQVEIGTQAIFTNPTIEELAEVIANTTTGLSLPEVEAVAQKPQHIPLSYAQQRLWIIDQLMGSVPYHLPLIQGFSEALNVEHLTIALQSVMMRHEVLRTVIREENGLAHQHVLSGNNWQPAFIELFKEEKLLDFVKDEIERPFDLQEDHMLRAQIYKVADKGYFLVLVLHHIASDGWSLNILINEVMDIYNDLENQTTPQINPLTIQYADYAIWEREYLSGDLLESKLSYWEEQLNGIEPLNLPFDFQRPPTQSTEGDAIQFEISSELTADLHAVCRKEGITIFMLLLSAFKVLLYRYTGQTDICVGSPIANRRQKELEDLIGFFANTIALRSDLEGNPSFKSLLDQIKTTTLNAYAHQDTPFAKIVERVVGHRDMSISPIFQTMFVLQNAPNDTDANESIAARQLMKEKVDFDIEDKVVRSSKFDLTLSAVENEDQLSFDLEYCVALFQKETIKGIQKHFTQLLNAIVADVNQPIESLNLLTKEEEGKLIEVFNDTQFEYPQNESVIDLIAKQAVIQPKAIALTFKDTKLTYRDLEKKSNQFANYLQSNGVKAGALLGLCIDRSPEMVIALLGILKSGNAYIPLDPNYPKDRIDYILNDAQVSYLVSTRALSVEFSAQQKYKLICVDEDWSRASTASINHEIQPDDLAYVIYTSGSTGNPKGVMIEQKSLVNFLCAMQNNFQLDATSSMLAVTTYSFDISYLELFLPLTTGAKVILADSEAAADGYALQDLIKENQPTHIQATPATWQLLVDCDWKNNEGLTILTGGEAIKESLKETLTGLNPTAEVWNMYGPTETTIWSAMQELKRGEKVVIGRPIANTQIYILDEQHQLCPVGIPGELYIGGDGLARGYMNRPDLTAERFFDNPITGNGLIYKTGDVARWLSNGTLEYLNRADDQVKIRGFRIELGEIESVLNEQEVINQAVVVAKEDAHGTNRLVAYIIPENEFEKTVIQNHLKSKLPEYMVPGIIVELETFPLTPNGKLDKKALPNPEAFKLTTNNYVAPTNDIEAYLANTWKELLHVEQLGIEDNFFEMGGHSLLATRVVAAARKQFHVNVSIRDLFLHPTIQAFGQVLSEKEKLIDLPRIVRDTKSRKPIPLSYAQERIWFLDRLNGSTEYHMPYSQYFDQSLDVEAMKSTLYTLVDRQEILRTVVKEKNGLAYQEVQSVNNWQMEVVSENDEPLADIIEQTIEKPFDLAYDYMFRAKLVELKDGGYLLLMVVHHIAFDAWSGNLFFNELSKIYMAKSTNSMAKLPPLDIQYKDFAKWQRKYFTGATLDKELSYWEKQLEGLSPLNFPTDFSRPQTLSKNGDCLEFFIEEDLANQLRMICRKENVTLFMFLLTVFKVLLYKYSGQTDICIGTVTSNRERQELENIIGFFINSIALRSDLSNNPVFSELLTAVKETTLDAYSHANAPFEKVVDQLIKERDPSRSPLFQVLFVLQNTPDKIDLEAAQEAITTSVNTESQLVFDKIEKQNIKSKFDLTFNVTEKGKNLKFDIEYCADLFKRETIQRLQMHFKTLLKSVVADASQTIGNLEMLTVAERNELLYDYNDTTVPYPKNKTVLDLFMDQAINKPENTALVLNDKRLTYKELDEKSTQFARYLKRQGIEQGALVPVCMDRSIEMIISFLGIIKSGAAYIPVDPAYPESRIQYILEDANASMIITRKTDADKFDETITSSLLFFEKAWPEVAQEKTSRLPECPSVDQIAYVVYTSGSTGKPKGVMVSHRALANLVNWHNDVYKVDEMSRATWYAGVGFDASVWELWPYVSIGASLYIIDDNLRLNIEALFSYFVKSKVTHSFLPTAIIPGFINISKNESTSLEYLLTGGDALSTVEVEGLDYQLVNNYGPTENAVVATYYPMTEADKGRTPPIGKQVNNVEVYLLDADLNFVPLGVEGELYIGGESLADGYLNKSELTAERFIPNPFTDNPEDRLYCTGDMARWLPDGNLQFLGRKDSQVKIRGYRIEIGEVESVLSECPLLYQGVVTLHEDDKGEKRLVAYVESKGTFDKAKIDAYLKSKLPKYMVPGFIVEMDALPLTANGKIDKKALPAIDLAKIIEEAYEAPRNKIEEQLAEIWKELLGLEKIGIHDNFFEFGGDSIISIQVVSRAKKYDLSLRTKDVFEYQTIAELATQINSNSNKTKAEQGVLSGESALLPIQKWFLDSGYNSKSHFNQSLLFEVDKEVSTNDLALVVEAMVRHHDALRFQYTLEKGEWVQTYGEEMNAFEEVYVEGTTVEEIENGIQEICNDYQASLDILKGELIKVVLMQTPENTADNRLFIVIHHIAVDGVSWRILMGHFREALQQLQNGQPIDLGQKTTSYRDWANTLNDYCKSSVVESQKTYWRNIADAYLPLPIDKDVSYNAPVLQKDKDLLTVTLDSDFTQALLVDVNQRYNTEINDILLTALAKTMLEWTNENKIVIGLEGHGREYITRSIDTSNTVGWFTTLYPLLLGLKNTRDTGLVLKSIKEQLRNIPNKGIGYGLLRHVHPSAEVRNSLSEVKWDIIFNYLGQSDNLMESTDSIRIAMEEKGADVAADYVLPNKIEINSLISDGILRLDWAFSMKHFHVETIEGLANAFIENLKILITHCKEKTDKELTPSDLGLNGELTNEELEALAGRLNEISSEGKDILKF